MKNSKSPGLDGFTAEFFKLFWVDLGKFIVKSVNDAYKNGSFSVTQNQGIITCIPKPNRPRHFLKKLATNVATKEAVTPGLGSLKTTLRPL